MLKMLGENFRSGFNRVAILLFKSFCNFAVEGFANAAQERIARGILHERMFEHIPCRRAPTGLISEAQFCQAVEAILQ